MLRKAGTMLAFPHVLLIDDNSADRDYYAHRLKVSSPDCVVVQAATGLSGLALCKQHSPDCVVLELNLPDMSGFELLLKLVPHVYQPRNCRDHPHTAGQSVFVTSCHHQWCPGGFA